MKNKRRLIKIISGALATVMLLSACGKATEKNEKKYTIDNIRDYIVGIDEKVELDDRGKPIKVNYIYEKAYGLENYAKQSAPTNIYEQEDIDQWQITYKQNWNNSRMRCNRGHC